MSAAAAAAALVEEQSPTEVEVPVMVTFPPPIFHFCLYVFPSTCLAPTRPPDTWDGQAPITPVII